MIVRLEMNEDYILANAGHITYGTVHLVRISFLRFSTIGALLFIIYILL